MATEIRGEDKGKEEEGRANAVESEGSGFALVEISDEEKEGKGESKGKPLVTRDTRKEDSSLEGTLLDSTTKPTEGREYWCAHDTGYLPIGPTEKCSREIINQVRADSVPRQLTVNSLLREVEALQRGGRYSQAARCFTIAFAKLEGTRSQGTARAQELASVLYRKMSCAIVVAERRASLYRATAVLEDCKLALHAEYFSERDLLGIGLLEPLRELEVRAEVLQETLLRSRAAGGVDDFTENENFEYFLLCVLVPESEAINTDQCAICLTNWDAHLDDNAFAVMTPCRHATCVTCLCKYYKQCEAAVARLAAADENSKEFLCAICRHVLSPTLVEGVANSIAENSCSSFFQNEPDMSPTAAAEQTRSLAGMLINFDFVIDDIESAMFDAVEIVAKRTQNSRARIIPADHPDEYIQDEARAALLLLQRDFDELRGRAMLVLDTESEEWVRLRTQLIERRGHLRIARENASHSMFSR